EAGLKPQEHQLLIAIEAASGLPSITSEYLGERMGMRRLSLDPYLRNLIRRGLAEVWPEAGEKGMRLTEKGRALADALAVQQGDYLATNAPALQHALQPFLGRKA